MIIGTAEFCFQNHWPLLKNFFDYTLHYPFYLEGR